MEWKPLDLEVENLDSNGYELRRFSAIAEILDSSPLFILDHELLSPPHLLLGHGEVEEAVYILDLLDAVLLGQ
jgi:hypothetical protein